MKVNTHTERLYSVSIQGNRQELEILRDMLQNPIHGEEDSIERTVRETLFAAIQVELKPDR